MMFNISAVVNKELCCSCGACAEVCGKDAIGFSFRDGLFVPVVDHTLCVNCKQCVKVCPSAGVDVKSVYGTPDLFNEEPMECFVAYSKNDELRHQGTSGGVVSTMVFELLTKKEYDRAFVLEYENFNGSQARIMPIKRPDDVIRSTKSKYIPASIGEVVKEIYEGTIGKAIVVATPCQLLAIKRSLALRRISDSDLLFIGLFCDKTLNYNIYNYYTSKFGAYDALRFRDKDGNGWPGDTVLIQNGQAKIVDKKVRMSLKSYFQLNRCRFCFDKLNQLADISCGDCYINGEQSKEGKSSVVLRTPKGHDAFYKCSSAIEMKMSSMNSVKDSQHLELKLDNYRRNFSSDGAFVLDVSNEVRCDIPANSKDLEALQLGAKASSVEDYKEIDNRIAADRYQPRTNKTEMFLKRLAKLFVRHERTKYVLIDNAGFINKGAELMLQSVVQQLETVMPEAKIVVPKTVFYENINYCHNHHILPLQPVYGGEKKLFKHFVYEKVLNKPWYITPNQIDVVLDAGGFQFGDQWRLSNSSVANKKKYYASFEKKNRKIVFLPQAFGPFEQPLSKQLMGDVCQIADLIYAREQVSYDYLSKLFPNESKIKLAPDFTCLSKKNRSVSVQIPDDYVVVVPNNKMVTHTDKTVSSAYFVFLCEIVAFLKERGETVVLLNHEGKDDEKLLVEVDVRLSHKTVLLSNLDALEVKRIIGGAKLLISSRFHGVVSGLTQGVPTLCTSWSHKYSELLKEHQCNDNMLSVEDISQAKQLIANALDNPSNYSSKEGCVDEIRRKSVQMWNEVFSLIKNN